MEKAPGIELENFWPSMSIKDRLALVRDLAGFRKNWTSVSFTKFGSLCYANDVDATTESEPLYRDTDGNEFRDGRFAIGPCMGREFVDDGRATIAFDRGPCKMFSPSTEAFRLTGIRVLLG